MSLPACQQRVLDRMEGALRASDSHLASMYAIFGRLNTGERTANCKFGDDGKTLFICADMYICRVKTNVVGTNY